MGRVGVGDAFRAGDAGGGDEEGEVFFLGGDFSDEFLERVFGRHIAGDGDDLAGEDGGIGSVCFGGIPEDFFAAACNVYFGSFRESQRTAGPERNIVDVPFAARTWVAIRPIPVPPPVTRQT